MKGLSDFKIPATLVYKEEGREKIEDCLDGRR